MSSRYLLLSGSAGPLTTLADDGRRHLLIDASAALPAHPAVVAVVESTIGRIMGQLGAEALAAQAWSGIPTVGHLSTQRRLLDGLADPQFDRIVVDCGSFDRALDLMRAPSILSRLLDAALTPRLAMWRFPAEPDSGDTIFESLSDARSELLRMQRALRHDDTVMRILASDDSDTQRCRDAASMFGVLGVASEVWLFGELIMKVAALDVGADDVSEVGEEYRLDLGLAGAAVTRARAGRLGDDLVVEFDDVTRWLPLPPVLLRCRAVDAKRTADGLSLRFVPDAAQWRQTAASGA